MFGLRNLFAKRPHRPIQRFRDGVPLHISEFRTAASLSGLPHGLVWKQVDPFGEPVFAEDVDRSLISLVGVEVQFDADDEGEMDDAPGLQMVRAATAVFRYDGARWQADAKAVFNFLPEEVLAMHPSWTRVE